MDHIHHLVGRAANGVRLFTDDADRRSYLESLGGVTERYGWRLLAYCLMRNHTHLLVEAPRTEVRVGQRRLRQAHAHALGVRHGVSDAVWQTGHRAVRIRNEQQLWAVAAYIASNPVDAGLCLDAARYRWSSHAATIGAAPAPPWLASADLLTLLCGSSDATARRRYALYVAERGRRRRPEPEDYGIPATAVAAHHTAEPCG
ncbi:transposase [Conexibacter woesei]|uniref:transposase n=1 Tax=Conexibacter woesei TaxID=191495 RepID=UPI00042850E6|nr:transposase [Conexibacter woesei]